MQTLEDTSLLQWRDEALESFMEMVKAPDGDFGVLARLSQALNDSASFQLIVQFLSRHPQGKQAFEDRPRIGMVDLEQLYQLPQNTLGYVYAKQMIEKGLKPLLTSQVSSDNDFLAAHLTETHDLWHIVTGFEPNILGEIKLEAFYVAQLYASRFWIGLLAKNLLKAAVYDVEISCHYMEAITQGWLIGKQANPLFGMRWNNLWRIPLEDIRSSLNLTII